MHLFMRQYLLQVNMRELLFKLRKSQPATTQIFISVIYPPHHLLCDFISNSSLSMQSEYIQVDPRTAPGPMIQGARFHGDCLFLCLCCQCDVILFVLFDD